MDITSIYQGVQSTPTESPNNSIMVEYRPKEERREMPKNAKVKSRNKSTTIQQIENGYLIIKREEVCYECSHEEKEDGEMEGLHPYTDWMSNITTTYSKEKPTEIDLMY
jgi:hypothetical protein